MKEKGGERNRDIEKTRAVVFEESKFVPDNQKYGLFSFPGTLAISQTPYYQPKRIKRSSDGTVILSPRNFLTGVRPNPYFSVPESHPDRYSPRSPSFSSEKDKVQQLKKLHDSSWKHPGSISEIYSIFEHMPSESFRKFSRRQKDGSLRFEPKNFLTSPAKRGSMTPGITFGKYPEYMSEPYQRKSKLETKGIKKAVHDSAFTSTVCPGRTFSNNEELFGEDRIVNKPNKRAVSLSKTWMKHGLPFKTGCKAGEAIGSYPEYMPNPSIPMKKRKFPEKAPWKSPVSERSTPTPSVSHNTKNLRIEFPSLRELKS